MSHRCEECFPVSSLNDIHAPLDFVLKLNRKPKKPLFIGKFTTVDWTGHARFYIFKCPGCGENSVDYLHGFTNGGKYYLRCKNCDKNNQPSILEICDSGILREEGLLPENFFSKNYRLIYLVDLVAVVLACFALYVILKP